MASLTRLNSIVLFDVDGTLTVPRQSATPEMKATLKALRERVTVGIVGGSDLKKQLEQLGETLFEDFDYVFSENGLHAFKDGKEFHRQNLTKFMGDANLNRLVKFTLKKISELEIPQMRGTFFELRSGMINVSPIGRNCTQEERDAFEIFDKEHKIREKLIAELRAEFDPTVLPKNATFPELQFSIGGQISFDVFPKGWDKTYCLQFLREKYENIFFFGDKTHLGGNDYEIYSAEGVGGVSVTTFHDTIRILKERFLQ
jgi:phosphomannomutase